MSRTLNNSHQEGPTVAEPLTALVKNIQDAYLLPPGLPEGATVTITAFETGYYFVEFDGKPFMVSTTCVSYSD